MSEQLQDWSKKNELDRVQKTEQGFHVLSVKSKIKALIYYSLHLHVAQKHAKV